MTRGRQNTLRWHEMRPAGQASILILGGLAGILVGALVLGAVARAIGREGEAQRAADLGALAGARAMYASYPRFGSTPNPHVTHAPCHGTSVPAPT